MKPHVSDALSFLPSFALVLLGMADLRKRPGLRGIAALPLLLVAAYLPFYFDGNYPGGGARLLADGLGVEQVLAIGGCLALSERLTRGRRRVAASQLAAITLGLGLLGFATYLEPDHAQLRDREGGRPMYESRLAPPRDDLLFVDTDHGLALARADRRRVARFKGDDYDRLVWDHHGRPTAWRYRYPFDGASEPHLERLRFPRAEPEILRIEAESLWPPRAQIGGWAWPSYRVAPCSSNGRVLALHGAGGGDPASVTIDLPPGLGGRSLVPRILLLGDGGGGGRLRLLTPETVLQQWSIPSGAENDCHDLEPTVLQGDTGAMTLELTSTHPVALDVLELARSR